MCLLILDLRKFEKLVLLHSYAWSQAMFHLVLFYSIQLRMQKYKSIT